MMVDGEDALMVHLGQTLCVGFTFAQCFQTMVGGLDDLGGKSSKVSING